MNTLFIGYGNPDRQDDGVAWHVLTGIANQLGLGDIPLVGRPASLHAETDFLFIYS